MDEPNPIRQPASSPCQAPPGYWEENDSPVDSLWQQLGQVRSLSFVARSSKPGGWNGKGNGKVVVEQPSPNCLTFAEAGVWRPDCGGNGIRFHNVFRWTLLGAAIRLEHLRFGEDHPVYLFDIAPMEGQWRSISPHQCSDDCYSAELTVHGDAIILRWSITGPKKQEEIEYHYHADDLSRSERRQ
jgi:hypothetical protein